VKGEKLCYVLSTTVFLTAYGFKNEKAQGYSIKEFPQAYANA